MTGANAVNRFKGTLDPVPHGGLFVTVPGAVVTEAGLRHGARVRGTLNEVPYRSSLMNYGGVFHLGIHKAIAEAAGVVRGAQVVVTIETDLEPLPTDVTPADLARALAMDGRASASWSRLAPAVRRGYVKSVIDAKKQETRSRRIEKIVETLHDGVPARRVWSPSVDGKRRRP